MHRYQLAPCRFTETRTIKKHNQLYEEVSVFSRYNVHFTHVNPNTDQRASFPSASLPYTKHSIWHGRREARIARPAPSLALVKARNRLRRSGLRGMKSCLSLVPLSSPKIKGRLTILCNSSQLGERRVSFLGGHEIHARSFSASDMRKPTF